MQTMKCYLANYWLAAKGAKNIGIRYTAKIGILCNQEAFESWHTTQCVSRRAQSCTSSLLEEDAMQQALYGS
jgi:hypothetical protein